MTKKIKEINPSLLPVPYNKTPFFMTLKTLFLWYFSGVYVPFKYWLTTISTYPVGASNIPFRYIGRLKPFSSIGIIRG